MKEKNEIDELFRNQLNKDYPYDEGLWDSVENQLKKPRQPRFFWIFNLNTITLFLVLLSCSLLPSDSIKSNHQATPIAMLFDNSEFKVIDTKSSSVQANATNVKIQSDQLALNEKSLNSINAKDNTPEVSNYPSKSILLSTNILPKEIKQKSTYNTITTAPNFSIETEKSILYKDNPFEFRMITLGLNSLISDHQTNPKNAHNRLDINKKQGKLKNKFYYVEIEASHSTQLSKKLSGVSQDFVDYKNKSETPLSKRSIGVNLLTDYKNFTLGVGIHFSKFRERLNYSIDGETLKYETIYDTNYRIVNGGYNSNGNQVLLIKEEINSNQIEEKIRTSNQLYIQNEFKRIQLPITLGYQKIFGKWIASIQSAFVINYLAESNSFSINKDLTEFESEHLKQFMYSQKNQASLGILLNEYMIVGGRFSHEYDLNSYTTDYNSKFQSYNLGIWIQWRPK